MVVCRCAAFVYLQITVGFMLISIPTAFIKFIFYLLKWAGWLLFAFWRMEESPGTTGQDAG